MILMKQDTLQNRDLYFGFQASVGITKHMGGLKATKKLLEMCQVDKDKYVLEVGCGVGKSCCYLTEHYGCRAVGIDISEKMIVCSKARAKKKGVKKKVEFMIADAQKLPFPDNTFDVVFCESVIAFLKDKRKAVKEFIRVVKPGGLVAFNEVFWAEKPSSALVEYGSRIMGVSFLLKEEWERLLKKSGLKNLRSEVCKVSLFDQMVEQIKWFSFKDYFKTWKNLLSNLVKNPDYRKFVKEALKYPRGFYSNMGYGIFVGVKKDI